MRLPRRWFVITLLVVVCLGVAGWVLLARYAGTFVESGVKSALDEAVPLPYETGKIAFRPGWGLTVEDLRVHAPEGKDRPDLLAVENVRVVLGLIALFRGEVSVERVVLSRVTLHLPTDEERLAGLQALFARTDADAADADLPPVELEDASIHLDPAPAWFPGGSLRVSGLSFVPRADGTWSLFHRTRLAGRGRVAGTLQGGGPGPLRAGLDLSRILLDENVRSLLPAEAQAAWDQLDPQGTASGRIRVSINRGDPADWQGSADLTADLTGLGTLKAAFQGGGRGPMDFEVELPGIVLDEGLRSRLPDGARSVWDRLRPRGRAAARAKLRIEGGHLAAGSATVELNSVTLESREPDIVWDDLKGRIEIALEKPSGSGSPPLRFQISKPLRGRLGGKGSGAPFTHTSTASLLTGT